MNAPHASGATAGLRARLLLALGAGWAAAPIALLAGAETSLAWLGLAGPLALGQLVLAFRAERAGWRRASLLATLLQGLLAAGRSEGPVAVALVIGTLVSVLLALGALAEDTANASLARLPRSGAARARGPLTGAVGALALALALLLLAPAFALLVDGASSALVLLDPRTRAGVAARPEPDAGPTELPGLLDGGTGGARASTFPATLEWASASPVEDDTPVVVLRWRGPAGGEPPAALHVRGRVLERFTETGLAPRPSPGSVELDARRDADGWSALEPIRGEPVSEPVHEYEVQQIPLRIGARAESLLFAPSPPLALDCPGARLRGEAELSAPLPPREHLVFRVQSAERRFEPGLVPAVAARHAASRALELPPPSPELDALRTLARTLTRGAADDRERVARVLAFFRDEFAYEPKPTGIAGLAGLAGFLERRAGSCTHYAATAALLLRTVGLPTRVVTGFLALPALEDERTYVATLRNGHAWFEVAFEGLGWVTCDATPGGSSNPGAALALGAREGGWGSGLAGLFERFLDGQRLAWGELARLLPFPAGVRVGLAALVVLLLVFLRRGARRVALSELPYGSRSPPPSPALERLLQALARAGHPRPPARTLREHARALATLESFGQAPLEPLVDALYRTRFGGVSWSDPDELQLARVLESLGAGLLGDERGR